VIEGIRTPDLLSHSAKSETSSSGNDVDSSGLSLEKCVPTELREETQTDPIEPIGGLQNGLQRFESIDFSELASLWEKVPKSVRDSWLVTARAFAGGF
jgi:hypothetical protein